MRVQRIALLVPLVVALSVGCTSSTSGRPAAGGSKGQLTTRHCDTAIEGPSGIVRLARSAHAPTLFVGDKTFSVMVPDESFGPVTSSRRDVADLMQPAHPIPGRGIQYDFATNHVGRATLRAQQKASDGRLVTWSAQVEVVCHRGDAVNG